MAEKVFLYGIGAAKSGTTWLSKCMRAHPECAMPPVKETHYFDTTDRGANLWAVDHLLRTRQMARDALAQATTGDDRVKAAQKVEHIDQWLGLVASGKTDDKTYEALMRQRLRGPQRVVADITPSYALLKGPTYARMAALNGGRTRFLLIMRDPLDRLCSNISMTLTRRVAKGADAETVREEMVSKLCRGHNSDELQRSNYARTLARLEDAVPEHKRVTVFFEELFQEDTMGRISDFLGLDVPLEPLEEMVNAGDALELRAAERAALAERLAPQYENALSRFGTLPARWEANMQGLLN